jgi:hypothetical protein
MQIDDLNLVLALADFGALPSAVSVDHYISAGIAVLQMIALYIYALVCTPCLRP